MGSATRILAGLALCAAALALGGCDLLGLVPNARNNPNDPGGGEIITGAAVNWVEPRPNATAVPLTTTVRVLFFNAMSQAATEAAFTLATTAGTAVTGTLSWNAESTELTFRPGSLESGVTYVITVSTGATAANNDTLDATFTSTFQTE